LNQIEGIGDWIGKYGLPIVVCSVLILFGVYVLVKIIGPELKARSQLKIKRQEAEEERKTRLAEAELDHQLQMNKLQEENQRSSLELTKVTKKAVEAIQVSQRQTVDAIQLSQRQITDPLHRLIQQHRDYRAGWQFETVTLKRAIKEAANYLEQNGTLSKEQSQKIQATLDEGLDNTE